MPSRNRTTKTGIWRARYFLSLGPTQKLVYLFLFTGEPSSETSVYPFPIMLYAPYLGLSFEVLRETIMELQALGLVEYDTDTDDILIIRYFENHPPNGGLTYEMFRNDLAEVHSERLIDRLVEVAKNYPVSIDFYAALADLCPELEKEETQATYKIKSSVHTSLDEARKAAQKGRANR